MFKMKKSKVVYSLSLESTFGALRCIGVRKALRFVKRLRRLMGYSWFALAFSLVTLTLYVISNYFTKPVHVPDNDMKEYTVGWKASNSCIMDDCKVQPPLNMHDLSPRLLLIMIHSGALGIERRKAIRDTWTSMIDNQNDSPIQYRFIIGGADVAQETLQQLRQESSDHNDLIIIPTVTDSRLTLTTRTIHSFKFVSTYHRFHYVLKCDDDSYIDTLRLASEVQRRKSHALLYWGFMRGTARIYFFGTYREESWFVCNKYMSYALGGGYVLSWDLVELLVQNEPHLNLYKAEDVSVGAWLAPYNIERKHDTRFNTESTSRGCKDVFLISHKVTTKDMYKYHQSLTQDGRFCSWKNYWHWFSGYHYNWTETPSRCCRRDSFFP